MENEYDVFKMSNVTLDDIHGYCYQHCYIGLYILKNLTKDIYPLAIEITRYDIISYLFISATRRKSKIKIKILCITYQSSIGF